MATTLNAGNATSGAAISADATGILALQSGSTPTTAVTVDTSQNVGIGTASPVSFGSGSQGLTINGTGNYQNTVWRVNETSVAAAYTNGTSGFLFGTENSSPLQIQTAGTERMRIDTSGNLLVNTTSLVKAGKVSIIASGSTSQGISIRNSNAGNDLYYCYFLNSSDNPAGSIQQSGSTTVSYVTSSDYRLKENVAPMTGALSKVSLLKPVTYTWKEDKKDGQGFIAHELQEVCPDAVCGSKDAVDENGNILPQGIDTSFLVATLTAAIQELNAKVDAQALEIQALKGVA